MGDGAMPALTGGMFQKGGGFDPGAGVMNAVTGGAAPAQATLVKMLGLSEEGEDVFGGPFSHKLISGMGGKSLLPGMGEYNPGDNK